MYLDKLWGQIIDDFSNISGKTVKVSLFFQELASLGLDRLKSALMALGLKCGG